MRTLLAMLLLSAVSHAQIIVTKPSKTGPQQESIFRTLDFITANIDEQCMVTLPNVKPMVLALEGDRVNPDLILIGHGVFEHTLVAAFTGATSQTVGYLITVNDDGAFFTDDAHMEGHFIEVAHKFRGGKNVAKVAILLHELSHALGVAEPDYNNQAAGDRNDKRILDNCSKTLKMAEKYKGTL